MNKVFFVLVLLSLSAIGFSQADNTESNQDLKLPVVNVINGEILERLPYGQAFKIVGEAVTSTGAEAVFVRASITRGQKSPGSSARAKNCSSCHYPASPPRDFPIIKGQWIKRTGGEDKENK